MICTRSCVCINTVAHFSKICLASKYLAFNMLSNRQNKRIFNGFLIINAFTSIWTRGKKCQHSTKREPQFSNLTCAFNTFYWSFLLTVPDNCDSDRIIIKLELAFTRNWVCTEIVWVVLSTKASGTIFFCWEKMKVREKHYRMSKQRF